jgi:tRNA G37 N-methylase TrmD
MENANEPVVQNQESGAIQDSNANVEVNNDGKIADAMPSDFKKDFFKHKQMMKEAQEEKAKALEKLKAYEEKEALAQGNYQKIIDTLKEENKKLNNTIAMRDLSEQEDRFNKQLVAKAEELGFTRPERIKNFISKEDKKLLVMGDDNKIDEFGLEKAFDNVKKEWSDLFRPKHVKIADANPTTNLNQQPQKSVKEMTSEERIQLALQQIRNK